MIKNILLFLPIILSFISCSSSDDPIIPVVPVSPVSMCRISSTKTNTLTFDDITITYHNSTFSRKFSFDYDDQDRIIKVYGGIKNVPSLQTFINWDLYDDVTDTIMYDGNVISVKYSNNEQARPYDKEFTIIDNKLVNKKVHVYNGLSWQYEYTYEYSGNEIVEKENGIVQRTFTIENGNLVKIERIFNSWQNPTEIAGKEEYIYSGFDNAENLLKGKFFINGAFYKAFSNNNYKRVDHNTYSYQNGTYVLDDYGYNTIVFGYDSNNLPDLFERNCILF